MLKLKNPSALATVFETTDESDCFNNETVAAFIGLLSVRSFIFPLMPAVCANELQQTDTNNNVKTNNDFIYFFFVKF